MFDKELELTETLLSSLSGLSHNKSKIQPKYFQKALHDVT